MTICDNCPEESCAGCIVEIRHDLDDQPPVPGGTTAIRDGQYVTEARADVTDDMTTAYMVGLEKGKAEARAPLDVERLARAIEMLRGLDWLYIFDKAAGGDGNGTHGQDRFVFNARVKAVLTEPTPSEGSDKP
jgi:hypothetical protein